jgi:hypothetical protein
MNPERFANIIILYTNLHVFSDKYAFFDLFFYLHKVKSAYFCNDTFLSKTRKKSRNEQRTITNC